MTDHEKHNSDNAKTMDKPSALSGNALNAQDSTCPEKPLNTAKEHTAKDQDGAQPAQSDAAAPDAAAATSAAESATAGVSASAAASADAAASAAGSATGSAAGSAAESAEDLEHERKLAQEAMKSQYHPIVLSDLSTQESTSFIRGYKLFWPFLKPYIWMAVLGIALTIPVGALDAVIALFLKPFTDNVMVAQNVEAAYYVPLVIIGFTLIQGLFIYLSSIVNSYVGGAINLLIRSKLYSKLLSFDTRFYDANNSGSVIMRFFNDAETASSGLISNFKLFLTKLFSSLSLIGVLLYNSWELTIIAIGVVLFLILPMRIVRRKIKKIVNKSVSASTGLITFYNETTSGSRVIKCFNLKDYMYETFRGQAVFLFKMSMKMVRDTNWLSPVMHLVSSLGVGAVLYFGVDMIIRGEITSGEFVSFLAALIMLYTPLKSIGNNYIQVQTALLALDRINQLLEYESFESGKNEGNIRLEGIRDSIEYSHVAFSYTGETDVLKDISFKVRKGQKVALVGNSGGGKSTVCSLITRLYEVRSGTIKIDGIDIREYTLESLRSQVSYVFQDNFLFAGTIRQNIMFGKPDATEEELENAVRSAFLDEFISTLPDGLDTTIGERGVSLSGGQKQRVAIARAIIRNAPLVILDEATSALDNRSEKVVQKALDSLMKGRTTLVIAHRLSTVRDADIIMVVNDGYIVEQGNHEQLLAANGAYANLYNSQFKTAAVAATSASDTGAASAEADGAAAEAAAGAAATAAAEPAMAGTGSVR